MKSFGHNPISPLCTSRRALGSVSKPFASPLSAPAAPDSGGAYRGALRPHERYLEPTTLWIVFDMRIPHAGSKAKYTGDTRNHAL